MSGRPRRMTLNRAAVIRCLLRQPEVPVWSYDVAKRTGVETGLVARILNGMEGDGYVGSWWASKDQTNQGPRRHWFYLTPEGRALRAEVLAFLAEPPVGADPAILAVARALDDTCAGCTRDGGQCLCCGLTHKP